MANLKYILAMFLLECSSCVFAQKPHNGTDTVFELQAVNSSNPGPSMEGSLFQTVKRYHCAWTSRGNATDSTLVLYGSKAWIFPNQDVRLDLTYPNYRGNSTELVVSMFDVILRIGGVTSEGYITSGGLLQEFITLSFTFQNITSLEYEFWLYGVPKWTVDLFDQFKHHHDLC